MGSPTEWIEIADFSPGIQADLHGFDTANPTASPDNASSYGLGQNGPATADNTYGCICDVTGALIPLPLGVAISSNATSEFGDVTDTAPTFYPTDRVGTFLLDARVISYVVNLDASATPITKVFLMYGAFYDPSATSTYRQLVWIVIADLAGTNWNTIHWNRHDPANPIQTPSYIMSGNCWPTRTIEGTRDADGFLRYDINAVVNAMGFALHSDPTPGLDEWDSWATGAIPAEEVALTNYTTVTGATDYPLSLDATYDAAVTGIYPDPLDLFSSLPRYVCGFEIIPGFMALGHQGRAVIACHTSRRFGGAGPTGGLGTGMYWWQDRMYFSPVYNMGLVADIASPSTTYFPAQYESSIAGDEDVNPIGTMGSISASELLMVKQGGGGVLMRGDLNNFEAFPLPYIESTYGAMHHGVPTSIGFVYGSKNGVFVWSGGESTECISPQIDTFFWNHAITAAGVEVPYRGNRGRMGYWQNLIAVPNNFLYNIDSKSWWRLDEPTILGVSAFNVYDVDAMTSDLVAFPHRYTPGITPKWYIYDPDVLRPGYSWQSQPLIETRDKYYTVETIELTVTTKYPHNGGQIITVTLTGIDENGAIVSSPATVFTPDVAGNQPSQVITKQIPSAGGDVVGTFNARYIQIKMVVSGGSGPAPKIHKVRIGERPNQMVPIRLT